MNYKIRRRFSKKRTNKRNKTKLNGGSNNTETNIANLKDTARKKLKIFKTQRNKVSNEINKKRVLELIKLRYQIKAIPKEAESNRTTVKSKKIQQSFCTECGTPLKPKNIFCTKCGKKIESSTPKNQKKPTEKSKKVPSKFNSIPKKQKSKVKIKKIQQKFCTECGTPLKPKNMFCTQCGKKINDEDSQLNIPYRVDINNLRLPKWFKNSCFLDSVIACLLIRPNNYLINRLLEKPLIDLNGNSDCSLESRQNIREELKDVFDYIHNKQNKSKKSKKLINFRKSLRKCKLNTFEKFTGSYQREANEFLKYLFSIFPDDDKQNLSETVYFTDDLETTINNESDIKTMKGKTCISNNNQTTDVYYFISPSDIASVSNPSVKLSSFLHSKEESNRSEGSSFLCNGEDYKRTIKFKEFKEDRYIIFDLSRAFAGQFLDQQITPDEEIELSNGKKFKFVSSVHRTSGLGGAHFTSFILLNDIWYYYNDISSIRNIKLKEVGNYNKLLTYDNEKVKQSVMYFYEPISP